MINKGLFYILFILIFALFLVKPLLFLDSDFGWHLQTGNLILSSGIPKIDPFSYSMPNFPFVDHSWLTDVFIAKLFPLVGFPGLATLSTIIVFLTFLTIKGNRATNILILAVLFSFFSIRPQIITWLFFAILVNFIFRPKVYQKWRYAIPGLFLVWANLHGGFVAGLILLFFVDLPIFFASLLITLINPYGFGLWREVWSTIADASWHYAISEWQPVYFWVEPSFIFLFLLAIAVLIRYWKKFAPNQILIFTFFSISAFIAVRNVVLFIFVAAFIITQGIEFFKQELKNFDSRKRFTLALNFIYGLSIFLFFLSAIPIIFDKTLFIEDRFYPSKATVVLKTNLPKQNIFSDYNWGGYLIWKLPEKKVFVDGRMPSWRQNGYSAFEEYNNILSGKVEYLPIFLKYHIDTVLWPTPSKEINLFDPLQAKINSIFKISPNNFDFLKKLETDGWQKIYQDQTAVIYQKPGA